MTRIHHSCSLFQFDLPKIRIPYALRGCRCFLGDAGPTSDNKAGVVDTCTVNLFFDEKVHDDLAALAE